MQSSKKEILNYIRNEKQISEFKINSLKASRSQTPSNRRIQKIEEEFVQFPFEDMFFDSISDVATAITLYRTSRHIFYRTYGIRSENKLDKSSLRLNNANTSIIIFRLKEVEKIRCDLKSIKFHQEDFLRSLSESERILFEKNKEKITKYTKRAINSCHYYLDKEIRSFKRKISSSICLTTGNNLKELSQKDLEDIFEQLMVIQSGILSRSLQYFNMLTKLKKKVLENLINENSTLQTLNSQPVVRSSIEKDIKNKVQRKVAGILLDFKTKNNEQKQPVALNIIINGVNVSHLFCSKISNIKVDGSYKKALMIKPISKFSDDDFETLRGLSQEQFGISKIEVAKLLEDVKLRLDNTSFLFAPVSRREGEHFSIVYKWFAFELSCIGI